VAEDPRIGEEARTANQILLEDAISRGISLERLKNMLVRDLVGFLNDEVYPEVLGKLTAALERIRLRGGDSGVWSTQRYADLLAKVKDAIDAGTAEARARYIDQAVDLASAESAWQVAQFDSVAGGLGFDFVTPPKATLRAIVTQEPFEGDTIRSWFDNLGNDTLRRVQRSVDLGLAQGETLEEIVSRVRGTKAAGYADGAFAASRNQAETIARTAAVHVSSRAREQTFAENSDVVKGATWVATLDDRTCPICGGLDGQTFDVGKGPRPPAHPNCRCTAVPALRSWKELGIDLSNAPPGTRASMNGEVPDSMTFPEWLRKQSRQTVEDVLGPGRADLFLSGEKSFDQFTNDRGRILTLAQLGAG